MGKKLIIIKLMLVLGIHAISAQSLFKGTIYADSIATTQINIVNLTQKIGSVNKTSGAFQIDASVGDEVLFSSVQYQPHQVTISQEMLDNPNNKIYLFPHVNELKEVNISNIDLSGDLAKDAGSIELNPFFDPRKKGLPVNTKPKPTTAQRRIHTATTGSGIIPIDPIINAISGRLAMVYRQRDYEIQEKWLAKGLQALPADFFLKELKLIPMFHEDFIYFCMNDERYKRLVTHDRFRLIEFYKEKLPEYQAFKGWKN